MTINNDKTQSTMDEFISIAEIEDGMNAKLKIMLCRQWDVVTIRGNYLSTDFIVSDNKGCVIHCTAKSNIAHCFINKLEEGAIYMMKIFLIIPNKKEYRIIDSVEHMIELKGNTIMKKIISSPEGFVRHPFKLVEIEDLLSKCHRGRRIRVSLWGPLGAELLKRKEEHPGMYAMILVAMNVKESRNGLNLSSTSATRIIDEDGIPTLEELKNDMKKADLSITNEPNLLLWKNEPNPEKPQRPGFNDPPTEALEGRCVFSSFGGRIDKAINQARAPYTFRITGQNYHRVGSLMPTSNKSQRFLGDAL